MCGLLTIIDFEAPSRHEIAANAALDLLSHRGPDGRGVATGSFFWSGHRRLAIVDPAGSAQPFRDRALTWAANGEIYNHRELRARLPEVAAAGDCAVLGTAWRQRGPSFLDDLDGAFAFTLCDEEQGRWIAARDPFGICPLYVGERRDGSVWIASEMKALVDHCEEIGLVAPGTCLLGDREGYEVVPWYRPAWRAADATPSAPLPAPRLAGLLDAAVRKRLMADVPLAVLLSGGLDSSLVAALAARARRENGDPRPLVTFSIGLEGAPDLDYARRVAEHIGSEHHALTFTVEEALAALPEVVWHLESYEQIRTAVPTFLLAQRVRERGFRVALSGEGADEIFGGYLYFHRAPDARSFHEECVRKLDRLHLFDVMRANKAPMAHGLELRFPFLDRALVETVMATDPELKMIRPALAVGDARQDIEKALLRRAFVDLLPAEVLWRQKEQFSDGVGYDWVDALEAHARARFASDEEPIESSAPEAPFLRALFRSRFVDGRPGGRSAEATVPQGRSIACSTPEALAWDPTWSREGVSMSGRAMTTVHRG